MVFLDNSPGEDEDGGFEESQGKEGEEEEEDEEEEEEEEEEGGEEGAPGGVDKEYPVGGTSEEIELFKKASAWYFVSHSDETNPYLRDARVRWKRDDRELGYMYLSFPWVCAYQQLCQIKRMKTLSLIHI